MLTFNEAKERYLEKLNVYLPTVQRVHGESHPELKDVADIFERLTNKLSASSLDKPELAAEFNALRRLTKNYCVPKDTCDSYKTVYQLLDKLDASYFN